MTKIVHLLLFQSANIIFLNQLQRNYMINQQINLLKALSVLIFLYLNNAYGATKRVEIKELNKSLSSLQAESKFLSFIQNYSLSNEELLSILLSNAAKKNFVAPVKKLLQKALEKNLVTKSTTIYGACYFAAKNNNVDLFAFFLNHSEIKRRRLINCQIIESVLSIALTKENWGIIELLFENQRITDQMLSYIHNVTQNDRLKNLLQNELKRRKSYIVDCVIS